MLVDDNEANIQIDETLSVQGDCRRDALLITAAKIALQYHFTHFDFVKNPNSVKGNLSHITNGKDTNISVFLCRGVCPTMYSADSIAHMLTRRFTSTDSAETNENLTNKCL